ncbi:MAG: ADP-glyceromanno-heptose 6-epimerase [Candidatus Omnitrophica bacterium]|nr:ADP-glyceromanno-heptose 6-epimerase [Candidatus Omnitrophota bacterium]
MIIVTGGAGFIGSALVWGLNARGHKDILIVDQDLEQSPKKKNLEQLRFTDYLESDAFLRKVENRQLGKPRAVFHQGACSSTTETDVEFLARNNTGYTRTLAEWCLKDDIYFSYASSAATYGAGELGYSDDDELTPRLKPLNPYGQSKLDFDIWAVRNRLTERLTGFRYFNVYGPNEYHKDDMRSMVHKGFEQARDTGCLRLFKSHRPDYADGGQKRDFVYVKDVVDAVLWFHERPEKKGIFNLGTGSAATWNDLAAAIFAALGKPLNVEYIPMPDSIRNQYQYFTEADLAKLRLAGYTPSFHNITTGARDYIQNYLQPGRGTVPKHPLSLSPR